MQSLKLNIKKRSNKLLDLIVWTVATRYILVVSPVSTVPTVTTIRSLVPHTLTPVKAPRERSLPTTIITSLEGWEFIASNLQTVLIVNDQEDCYQAIDMRKTFYDAIPDDPYDGGDNDNVGESGNENDIDAVNYDRNANVSER